MLLVYQYIQLISKQIHNKWSHMFVQKLTKLSEITYDYHDGNWNTVPWHMQEHGGKPLSKSPQHQK